MAPSSHDTHELSESGPSVDVSVQRDERSRETVAAGHSPRTVRLRSLVVVAAAALAVGVAVGALAIDLPEPAAIPITLAAFPEEMFGVPREDVGMRSGGSEPALERLDSQFEAELNAYRLAYGGEGAQFSYGGTTLLEIVNGQLAPQVPIADTMDGASEVEVSLISGDVTCVSSTTTVFFVGAEDAEATQQALDELLDDGPDDVSTEVMVFSDCVLFDRERVLSVRLTGQGPENDVFQDSRSFRDEIERIHASLLA